MRLRWLIFGVTLAACSGAADPERDARGDDDELAVSAEPTTTIAAPVEAPVAAPPPPLRIRLALAGDLVLNPHAAAAVEDDGDDGYAHLLAGFGRALDERELTIVNVEQPLVNDVVPLDAGWPRQDPSRPRRSPVLGATPPLAAALAAAGADVATLANNHAYDQRREGLQRTVDLLREAGVETVGAGADSDAAYGGVLIEHGGVRVGVLSFSDFFNQPPEGEGSYAAAWLGELERVEAAVTAMRARADVVVVAVHWSRDFVTEVRTSERELAARLIELGADVIAGTGPHVLHEVERRASPRGEAVVAYSLGNLVSGMGRSYRIGHPPQHFIHPANVTPEARDGVVLHVELELWSSRSGRVGRVTVRALDATPLWTENNWNEHRVDDVPHRVRVVPLAETEADVRAERSDRIRRSIGEAVTLIGME